PTSLRISALALHDALPISHGEVLQLALPALVADGAVERVVDEQELHHPLLRLDRRVRVHEDLHALGGGRGARRQRLGRLLDLHEDRKSTRLNSSHVKISYA